MIVKKSEIEKKNPDIQHSTAETIYQGVYNKI